MTVWTITIYIHTYSTVCSLFLSIKEMNGKNTCGTMICDGDPTSHTYRGVSTECLGSLGICRIPYVSVVTEQPHNITEPPCFTGYILVFLLCVLLLFFGGRGEGVRLKTQI